MKGKRMIVERSEFISRGVAWILQAIDETLQSRDRCHLMLAGGGTPLPIYRALAKEPLPWGSLELYFGDERCVPPDHVDSNYRAIMQALFPQGQPPEVRVHRLRGEADPVEAAREYSALLPQRIDVLLLGMGGDGHTASLFPGSPALTEEERPVMPVIGSKPPPQRLTVTPPVIQNARRLLVMVEGAGKADAVRRALEIGDVPVALAREGDWLMDQAAASLLEVK
jgi:6-phosphogluconolactonase